MSDRKTTPSVSKKSLVERALIDKGQCAPDHSVRDHPAFKTGNSKGTEMIMPTEKINQLFTIARNFEPYIRIQGFEERLCKRLDRLNSPPQWLQFGLPLLGAMIGMLILVSNGTLGHASHMARLLAENSFSLSIWAAGLTSLFLTSVSLLGIKKYLHSAV
mgnify:CR=1 FL=1